MKALILNSGLGSRMGEETTHHPKCMTMLNNQETIISRQLRQLHEVGITDVVITTGYFSDVLEEYCRGLEQNLNIDFIRNSRYSETNYIFSIYCAINNLKDDIIFMHGDLVFDTSVLEGMLQAEHSCMAVDSVVALPDKDFKAVIANDRIDKVGIEFFDNAIAAQPLYVLKKKDWLVWLAKIKDFCDSGNVNCYAENAFNTVSDQCLIFPFDVKGSLCGEIDNQKDWEEMKEKLDRIK